MPDDKKRHKLIVFLTLIFLCLLAIFGYVYLTGEKINWNLTLIGREGSREITFQEIKKMSSWEGWGGFFTSVGVINGPFSCKGVLVEDLCSLVGGITPADCLWVSAPDGYSMVFAYEQVKGDFVIYDARTLKEVPARDLKMILMYEQNGAPLTEDEGGPLRIAIAGPGKFLTEGHYWVKWVNKMEVRPLRKGQRK